MVRHFKAPDGLDVRFHEIRAKSVLNEVPAASSAPFRWTVNPYRGCTHACVYCLAPETPVLLADGSVRAIGALERGDAIYGTELVGGVRRFVRTVVRDQWWTRKRAYRVTLADGTAVVASGDHRFLSVDGWRFVRPGAHGGAVLAVGETLVGTGAFAAAPEQSDDYRLGYLDGIVRSDASAFAAPVLDRVERYLGVLGLSRERVPLAVGGARAVEARRVSARDQVTQIRHLVQRPPSPSPEWRRGFLAAVVDAHGTAVGGTTRIVSDNGLLLGWAIAALEADGFEFVAEERVGIRALTLLGDAGERLRFTHMVAPALTGQFDLAGMSVRSDADLRVVSVEPAGELDLVDITTGTGDFIANGVVSHNCFARPTHEFLDMSAGRDFEREIVVKVNTPEVLRAQLAKPSWCGEHIALGTNTDPYQWVEKRYELTRGVWEVMLGAQNPCSVLTKSPLLLRDIDLFKQLVAHNLFNACMSVPTLDEKAWRATEPHTPHPKARLEALAELNRQGIPCGVLIAPLMPGINDDPKQVEPIIEAATAGGTVSIGGQALFLPGAVRDIYMTWLREYRPDLIPEYERLYARGRVRAPLDDRRRIETVVRERKIGPREEYAGRIRAARGRLAGAALAKPSIPTPEPILQGTLF